MTFRVLHGLAPPPYLNDLFMSPTCPVVADFARHHQINCLFHHSGSQPSVDAHFQSLHHSSGTHCHRNPIVLVSSSLLSTSKNIPFCQSFPNIVLRLRLLGLHDSSAILGTLKNFIDIDIDIDTPCCTSSVHVCFEAVPSGKTIRHSIELTPLPHCVTGRKPIHMVK